MTMAGSTARRNLWGAAVVAGCLLAGALLVGQTARAAAPSCSVTFEGTVSDQWSNPANWSTGEVPGPSGDVCITKASPTATGKIDIHSLQVGPRTFVAFESTGLGHKRKFASVTISDVLIDTSDSFVLIDGTLAARTIDNPGSLVAGTGPSTITSPALSITGTIEALNGTLQLTDEPLQLRNGTLTGGTLEVSAGPLGGAIRLPFSDEISSIAAGTIDLSDGGASIENESGGNALASLSSIGQNATLIDHSFRTVINGNLVSQGHLQAFGLTVHGNLVSEGLFEAGGVDVLGDYTQTSTGTLAMNFGPRLSVGKTATLNGTLVSDVRTNCTPKHDTITTAITFAARRGKFTTQNTPFINVFYGAKSVEFQFVGTTNRTGCGGGG